MAIESTPQKCMTVNQIYTWCETNFPFYKHAGAGWKNSLRHNLSINKSFKRLPRDSRGPGRGAFWTVEPRERPALMDAIRRNPWNFANLASLVSGHSESQTPANRLFGVTRSGLSQSAPSHFFRNDAFGNALSLDPKHASQLAPGGVQFLTTADGHVIATLQNAEVLQRSFEESPDFDETLCPSNQPLPDSRYWFSPEESSPKGIISQIEWSAEDEEKYGQTMKLLLESNDQKITSVIENNVIDSNTGKVEANPARPTEELKLVTKQRRKSRLLPTRTAGFCNECKENAAAGCDSCQARRLRFLADPLLDASARESALLNALDSDQEQGPAGGPTVRATAADTDGEVFVTPAPYLDHEYSHCQAQLRRPEESRVVNRFNEAFGAEALRRMRKRPAEMAMLVGRADEVDDLALSYEEDEEDRSSSHGFLDDYETGERVVGRSLSQNFEDGHTRKRGRRGRSKKHRVSGRGRVRRRDGFYPGSVTRRSKRVIKAPRRPYDELGETSVDTSAPASSTEEQEPQESLPRSRGRRSSVRGRRRWSPEPSDPEAEYLELAVRRQQCGVAWEPAERTTVEAAQLLLGMSQMQNFRRQSGYISLDSSSASADSNQEPLPTPLLNAH